MDKHKLNEQNIKANELLAEFIPLLQDYFYGKIVFNGETIIYSMPNGQCFRIFAEEEI